MGKKRGKLMDKVKLDTGRKFGQIQYDEVDVDDYVKMEQLVGQTVTIVDCAERDGDFGAYITMVIKDPDTGKHVGVPTGSKRVMHRVLEAKKRGWLPMSGTVREIKCGNMVGYTIE